MLCGILLAFSSLSMGKSAVFLILSMLRLEFASFVHPIILASVDQKYTGNGDSFEKVKSRLIMEDCFV